MTDAKATESKSHVKTWTEYTTQQKIILALVVPLVLGVIAGLCLGWNAIAYLVMQILICTLAFLSGTEHVGALPGALRAANGGVWFGAAILVTDAITGWEETVPLPHNPIGLIVLTAGVGAILGAWAAPSAPRPSSAHKPPDHPAAPSGNRVTNTPSNAHHVTNLTP